MARKRSDTGREADTGRQRQFEVAVQRLASRLGAPPVSIGGTPISIFRSRYSSVLKRVRAGSIEVVTQNGEPFVILGLNQLITMCARIDHPKTAADMLAGLPSVPASPHVVLHRLLPLFKSHHRVPSEE